MSKAAPLLQIDLGSTVPVYGQIVAGIRAALVDGKFEPGDQLPTVRELALALGVNHNTVAEAYRILAAEGWLDLRQGRGATVLARPRPTPKPEDQARLARRIEELTTEAIALGLSARTIADELEAAQRKVLSRR
jgi:GntR family transcriptional regulator